jgi:hypothetical protein
MLTTTGSFGIKQGCEEKTSSPKDIFTAEDGEVTLSNAEGNL